MNATTFTTAFLREIIPSLIFTNKAVTVSTSYCNQSLVEFSKELEIEINSAEKENDLIKIKFSQHYDETSEGFGDGESFDYEMLVEKETLENLI